MRLDETNKSINDKAWAMHCQGKPPSEIALKLGISVERAKQAIFEHWWEAGA